MFGYDGLFQHYGTMKHHNVLHSAFQSVKGIRARRAGTAMVPFISYPPSPLAASSVHLVPMFLYWHMSRFLKVFLKVALQSA